MYKPVKFIAKIPFKDSYTYYLFCLSSKTLLPVEIEKETSETSAIPSIYNSLGRILKALKCSIVRISIYHINDGILYTYLTIQREKFMLDLNIGFKDGMEIAKELSIPIYVKEKIIQECGIEVTKELINRALKI